MLHLNIYCVFLEEIVYRVVNKAHLRILFSTIKVRNKMAPLTASVISVCFLAMVPSLVSSQGKSVSA